MAASHRFIRSGSSSPTISIARSPARQNRWVTGFRFVLIVPALLMSETLSGGGSAGNSRGLPSGGVSGLAAMLSWFSALVRGRSPRGLRDFIAWGIGYTAQVYAYPLLLRDFTFGSNDAAQRA